MKAVRVGLDCRGVLILEDVVVRAIGRRQRLSRYAGQLAQHGLPMRLPPFERGQTDIVPAIVPAQVAQRRGRRGALGQLPLPRAFEERVELLARACGDCADRTMAPTTSDRITSDGSCDRSMGG